VTRVAVADLGTNSTRLLVADVDRDGLRELDRRLAITRLGEGVDERRLLLPAAVERVASCLARYEEAAAALGAELRVAVATSAVRDAANGEELLALVAYEHGFAPRVLSGDDEALLTFHGVTSGRTLPGRTLVVDVGGGSTELVLGSDGRVERRVSLDLGCVRLTERFLAHDPPSETERAACAAHSRALVAAATSGWPPPETTIGVAGTVTTLATLHLGLDDEIPDLLDGHELPAAWIAAEAARIASTPRAVLARTRGIHPDRAPVLAGGAIALAEILDQLGVTTLGVSLQDILHGAALAAAAGEL
jgi:exopolyphosphatase/guanosine-5'-triphosphate,3'-diphosphate pyrophosphatase